jgi:hypothetical protein
MKSSITLNRLQPRAAKVKGLALTPCNRNVTPILVKYALEKDL